MIYNSFLSTLIACIKTDCLVDLLHPIKGFIKMIPNYLLTTISVNKIDLLIF